MLTKAPPKQPLSCRVEADVLARLKSEAAEQGTLFTLYIEACITNYKSVVEALDIAQRNEKSLSHQLADSETEIEQLKSNNATQLQTIEELSAICERLNAEVESLSDERDTLQVQLETVEEKNELLTTWTETLQETIGHFEEKNQELQTEVTDKNRNEVALQNKVKSLSTDNQDLNGTIQLLKAEKEALTMTLNQRLPAWLTEKSVQKVKPHLDSIHQKYPSVSCEDLLILTMATAARNEKHTLRMFNIADFHQRNPDFFTIKSPTLSPR